MVQIPCTIFFLVKAEHKQEVYSFHYLYHFDVWGVCVCVRVHFNPECPGEEYVQKLYTNSHRRLFLLNWCHHT